MPGGRRTLVAPSRWRCPAACFRHLTFFSVSITITVFSAYPFEWPCLVGAAQDCYRCRFLDAALTLETAAQAVGSTAVAIFVNADASAPVLEKLRALGVRYLLVRAAGHDNVDLPAAHRLGVRVATVSHYSPFAIAEHALALMLALNRHLHQADAQVRRGDQPSDPPGPRGADFYCHYH